MDETRLLGLGTLGLGCLLFLLGLLLLLDRALLIMANLLIMISIILLMGFRGFLQFLKQKEREQGTIAFFLGIFLVCCKLPLPGIICELTGAYWLFGGFFPMLISLLTKVPFISVVLPFLSKAKEELPL